MVFDKITEYCSKNGISIMAFEQMCKIGNGTVARWKDNNSNPSLVSLQKIEKYTKIPIKKWLE
ncbi:MAG: helix-turn-helix transcriptional regulator [Firmicutes bacterium]|nr:helix-turn-helix transcriptional regulator [Candidatus Fiminaster equi]